MPKQILLIAAISLAGCASTSEWRALSIDGSDEAAFGQSLALINDGLSSPRRDMFALALVDIAQTGVSSAGQAEDGSPAYTDEEYRRQLDGLTYDGVIALADESGPSVYSMYYYADRRAADSRLGFESSRQPTFAADGRPTSDYRPGGDRWPTGSNENGGLIYPYD